MPQKKNPTNEATKSILNFLLDQGVFCWRQNVLPVGNSKGEMRSASKKGIPDICGIYGGRKFVYTPGDSVSSQFAGLGIFFGVEVKRGKDKLRPEQIGFHTQAQKLGAIIITAVGETADEIYNNFLNQWQNLTR